MKVLFINTNDTSGGAARAAWRIMRGVRQSGVETQMFVKNKNSQAPDVVPLSHFVPSCILYRAIDWIASKFKNKWQHFKWHPYKHTRKNDYLSDTRFAFVHGALQKLDYDIVHLHWINNRFLDIRELSEIKKPIVWTIHDTWPFCGVCHYFDDCDKYQSHCGACPKLGSSKQRDLAFEVFEKKLHAFKNLNLHIVAPSKWLAECVKESTLLGKYPITVIPNCLDTDEFRPFSKEEILKVAEAKRNPYVVRALITQTTKPIILFGAINAANDKRKGVDSLKAALQTLDQQGYAARLVVFGTNEQELSLQFEHIEVMFVGHIVGSSELAAIYSHADVMVVPSYSEVFGQTASEAMACGTPVVAFRCTGIQEVVEEGCGYLAEPFSSEDLANGIRYCIECNENNILGKAAREYAINKFSINVVARQYKELYQSL